ncbi:MAG: hypothetical protein ACK4ND_07675 [Cytophagaceae bacterium]
MFKYTFKIVFLLAITILIGCRKAPDYPNEPIIRFEKIEKFTVFNPLSQVYSDSVVISIHFTDGDGDLGLSTEDVEDPKYKDKYNYMVKIFRRVNNQFELWDPPISSSGNFAPLVDKGYRGPIDGILKRNIDFPISQPSIPANSVVRFEIQIMDRALNKSNTITTSEITVKAQ